MSSKPRALTVPAGWGVSQMILHYEREDLSKEPDPFAATAVVHLRMDAEPGTAPAQLAAQDRLVLQGGLANFKLIADGELAVGGEKLPRLEATFEDEDGRPLQQLTLYLERDRHLYTVTGTHRAGPRFEAIRSAVAELAASVPR